MQTMNKFALSLLLLFPSIVQASNYLADPHMEEFCKTLVDVTKTTPFAGIDVVRETIRAKVSVMPSPVMFNLLYNEAMTSSVKEDGEAELNYSPESCSGFYAILDTAEKNRAREFGAPVQHRNAPATGASYLSQLDSTFNGGVQAQQHRTAPVSVGSGPGKVSDCETVLNFEACRKPDVEAGIFDFAKDWIDKLGGEKAKACNCLSKKLELIYQNDQNRLTRARDELSKKLTNAVYTQLGRKFLNDYAANIENIAFYTTSVPTFFGKTMEEQQEKAQLAQCSKPSMFETAIRRKCGSNKIPQSHINKRVNAIFGVYGRKEGSIEKKLEALNYKISVLDGNGVTKNANGEVYTRFDHDTYRASLVKTDYRHKMVDSIVKKAMKEERFIDLINEDPKTPYEIISAELFKMAKESPEKFAATYFPESDIETKSKFFQAMQDSSQTPEQNIIASSIATSMGLHPGFDTMMRDKKILKKVIDLSYDNNQSLTDVLETKESGLLDKYQDQCKSIVNNFAEIVCMDSSKMANLISNEQALQLIPLPYEEQDIVRDIMCKKNGNGDSDLVQNLMMENLAEKRSDFHDRMNVPVADQTNPFRKMYTHIQDKNSEVLGQLNDSIIKTRGLFSSLTADGLVSTTFGSKLDAKSITGDSLKDYRKIENLLASNDTTLVPFKPETSSDIGSSMIGLPKPDMFQNNMMNQAPVQTSVPAYQNAAVASQPPTAASKSLTDMKKEFRDFLSNESNKDNVDRLVSGADESMIKELSKLRDEYTKNQTRLSELTTEHEKLKLKMMEDQLRSLEEEKTQLVPQAEKREVSKERTAESTGLSDLRREIASVSQIDSGSASAGVASGSSSGSTGGGRASVLSGGSSQAAISSVATGDSAPAVIVSSQAAKASGLTVESSDYSKEIMSFLEKDSVDIHTLLKMKTSGMVYKYKVVENGQVIEKEMLIDYQSLNENAKKMIDLKIAAKGIDVRQLERIDGEMKKLKREYTYNSLRVLLTEQLRK